MEFWRLVAWVPSDEEMRQFLDMLRRYRSLIIEVETNGGQVTAAFNLVGTAVTLDDIACPVLQRIRGASGPADAAPWQVQVDGVAVEEVTLEGNRATVAIRDLNGLLRFEIYDVRTGTLIGIFTREGL